MSSENRHPNKKRRATSPDEQGGKRICLPRSSAAASADSIAATSANASHGRNSNKRAREEQSTMPSNNNKRARVTPLLPDRSIEQQLREAAAAIIALAQNAKNINKSTAIDEAVVLPGGKRIRIEAPVVSSNNNGIGRPRSNRRRRNRKMRTAPAPTAPAPEATAATSTATASNQAASNKIRVMPSNSILLSNNRKQNKGCSVRFSAISKAQPFDKKSPPANVSDDFSEVAHLVPWKMRLHKVLDPILLNSDHERSSSSVRFSAMSKAQPFKKRSTPENVSNDFPEEKLLIPMRMVLHDVVEEKQPPEEEEGPSIGDEAGYEPAMDVSESAARIQALVRGVYARKMLIQAIRAATMIQATYRGVRARSSATKAHEAATKIQASFRGYSTRSMKPRAKPQFEVAAAAMDVDVDDDGQESVDFDAAGYNTEDDTVGSNPRFEVDDTAAMDATAMVVDNDGQDSVNSDVASNASESNNTEAIEEEEEEDEDAMDEEEEVEVVQPAPRRRPRMLAEIESTLDGWYWRQATTRRFIDRN